MPCTWQLRDIKGFFFNKTPFSIISDAVLKFNLATVSVQSNKLWNIDQERKSLKKKTQKNRLATHHLSIQPLICIQKWYHEFPKVGNLKLAGHIKRKHSCKFFLGTVFSNCFQEVFVKILGDFQRPVSKLATGNCFTLNPW